MSVRGSVLSWFCWGGLVLASAFSSASQLAEPIWDTQGPQVWERSGGEWRAQGAPAEAGYLVSRERYGAVRLRVEVWLEPETNSGVFVGCASAEPISPTACYEINLWDHHPQQQWRTGALVGISPPLNHVDTLGHWNRLEILVEDKRLRVWINDILTADRMTEALRVGHLALQFGGSGAVRVRHLLLEQP